MFLCMAVSFDGNGSVTVPVTGLIGLILHKILVAVPIFVSVSKQNNFVE